MTASFINFYSKDIDFEITQPDLLSRWVSNVIAEEKKSVGQISFILCSDNFLYQINVEYLQHDTLTDVITFPYAENPIEGDVFISIDRIKENAKNYKVSFEDELHRIIVHGVLHLIGYTDKSPSDKQIMTNLENKYLQKLNVKL